MSLSARIFVVRSWLPIWLELLEATVITLLVCGCGWRIYQWGAETNWTFHAALPLLSENWKGALILGAAMFYRTVVAALSRMKPFFDTYSEIVVNPTGPTEEVDASPHQQAKR